MSDTLTMNALVLHGVGDARLERVARPKPRPGQVLVRVGFCGVCGSDIPRLFTKGTYRFPTICGHEFSGTVETCGPAVDHFSSGDRVTAFPLIWCGKCPACEEGRYAQCSDYDYLGSRCDGGFAEYVVVPQRNLISIPSQVSLEEAAMTEPAAVALHALKRVKRNLTGQAVVLFGAGPIGLMAAQWAQTMGADPILLFDPVAPKRTLARQLGFEHAYDVREQDPVDKILALTCGRGATVSVEAAGVPMTFIQAIQATGRDGCVIALGNPSADVTAPAAVLSYLLRQEITIQGVWNSTFSATGNGDDWRTTLQAVAAKKIALTPLVTHRVKLKNALETLTAMRDGKEFFCKTLIDPGSDRS